MIFQDKEKLGKFIKTLRDSHKLTQEDLAKSLDIPRPSVSQIENGSRDLNLAEFDKLTRLFGLSFDDFSRVYKDFLHPQNLQSKESLLNEKIKLDSKKFTQLLLYILEKCGSKPNVGETVIYKLLYFCDFDYFELYEQPLTGMIYKKLQFGPVPKQTMYNAVITDMVENKQLTIIQVNHATYFQKKYVNLVAPDLSCFNSKEIELINKVINRLSDMNARQIEDHAHKDYPWIAHDFNQDIDYATAFNRTGEFSQRDYDNEFLESALQDTFGSLKPITKEDYDYYMALPDKHEPSAA